MTIDCTFNGWANRATWNIALWMGNEETLTVLARRIANGGGNYKDLAGMGYQVNPGRTGNRWQKVNGVMQDSTNWFDRFNPMLLRPMRVLVPPDQCREAAAKEPPVVGWSFCWVPVREED